MSSNRFILLYWNQSKQQIFIAMKMNVFANPPFNPGNQGNPSLGQLPQRASQQTFSQPASAQSANTMNRISSPQPLTGTSQRPSNYIQTLQSPKSIYSQRPSVMGNSFAPAQIPNINRVQSPPVPMINSPERFYNSIPSVHQNRIDTMPQVQQIQQSQTIVSNNHKYQQHNQPRYEQPLQVVDLKQYQERWITEIRSLQEQLQNRPPVEDETKINELLERLRQQEKEKSIMYDLASDGEELRNQLRNLEEQLKKKQKEYDIENKKKNEELNDKDSEIDGLMNELKNLEDQINKNTDSLSITKQELEKAKQENRDARRTLQSKEQEVDDLKCQINELNDTLNSKSKETRNLTKENERLASDLQSVKDELSANKNQNRDVQEKLRSMKQTIEDLEKDNSQLRKQLKDGDQKYLDLMKQYEEAKRSYESLSNSQSTASQQNIYLVSEINTLKEQFKELAARYRQASEELNLKSAELDNLRQGSSKGDPRLSVTRSTVKSNTQNRQATVVVQPPTDRMRDSGYSQAGKRESTYVMPTGQNQTMTPQDIERLQQALDQQRGK